MLAEDYCTHITDEKTKRPQEEVNRPGSLSRAIPGTRNLASQVRFCRTMYWSQDKCSPWLNTAGVCVRAPQAWRKLRPQACCSCQRNRIMTLPAGVREWSRGSPTFSSAVQPTHAYLAWGGSQPRWCYEPRTCWPR